MTFLSINAPIHADLMAAARIVPHQVSAVKLSKTQLKVLDSIRVGEEVTAQLISERCDLSLSWSSTNLRRLFEKCYLKRRGLTRLGGGQEFNYSKNT